jgi:hypothetical protein
MDYCGVRQDVIKAAHPIVDDTCLSALMFWINEREQIRIKKKQGQDFPWTADPILSRYRFVNVRREHDRQTQYLIEHIVNNPELDIRGKIANIILFRYWGQWSTMAVFSGAWTRKELTTAQPFKHAAEKYEEIIHSGKRFAFFTKAYPTTGVKLAVRKAFKTNNSVLGAFKLVRAAIRNQIPERAIKASTPKESMEVFKELPGVANFLAYQMWVDCTYIKGFPFTADSFVVVSPKSKNALTRLFKDRDGMTLEECVFWIRDNFTDGRLSVMNLEHCLSGFSEYYKAVMSKSRPKRRYKYEPDTE